MSWDELVTVALLGTERRRPPVSVGDPALDALVAGAGPEDALLRGAGALATWRAAGAVPARDEAPPVALAPEEDGPGCSPGAAGALTRALGEHPSVVPEWLGRAAGAGVRPPPEHLPALLDLATHDRPLRAVVLATGGRRLGWLAALHDRWAWALGADDLGGWDTGGLDARVALLRAVRAQDAAAGRALVERTWAQDDPKARAAFLGALATGLGGDDEPLLEAALDDRRREVRAAAAETLALLPGSALLARHAARLAPLVRVGRRSVEVAEAPPPDAAAKRDGLRAGVLHLVAVAPLMVWGDDPAHVVGHAAEPLHAALAQAAVRQRDATWLRQLWAATRDPSLVRALPPDDARAVLAEEARTARRLDDLPDLHLAPAPWGSALVDPLLRLLLRDGDAWAAPRTAARLAERAAPDQLALVVEALEPLSVAEDRRLAAAADRALDLLHLRTLTHRELPA